MMNRGLFGASARNRPFVEPETLDPANTVAPVTVSPPAAAASTPGAPPAREFLGGLIKYQRPEGQTDAQRMALIGAMLSDVGAGLGGGQGGALAHAQQQFETQGRQERARSMMKELYPDDPQAQLMFDVDPSALSQAWLKSKEPKRPKLFEGPDGIYAVDDETGEARKIQAFDRRAPSGWEWSGDELTPIKNGPYDPNYIGNVAGVRRDAVVKRPMPSRGRGGGGGGAAAGPWKRDWR